MKEVLHLLGCKGKMGVGDGFLEILFTLQSDSKSLP